MDAICFEDARGRHLLVGLSGGADSVALLCLLAERRQELQLRLTAAHLHHGIRGEAADGDAAFCRALCRRLGVDLIEERLDIPAIAAARRVGVETAAREERRSFLLRAMRRCGADWIALAHHMDDQAETMLMHLFRGAGAGGLRGMRRLEGEIYRPLLGVRRAQLREFLAERGESWREDATNALADNPRNAIRLNVLPEIEKSYPRCTEAIARFGCVSELEDELLSRMTDAFLAERLFCGLWGARIELSKPYEEAILRRGVRSVCRRLSGEEIGWERTRQLAALARAQRGRLEISAHLLAEKAGTRLYFLPKGTKKTAAAALRVPGETQLCGICRVLAQEGNFEIDRSGHETELLNGDCLRGAVLRTRRPGDRFHPLGAPGEKPLSDYLCDKKLDRPLRDTLPLICAGERVLWVCGLGIAEEARVREDGGRRVRIRCRMETDMETDIIQNQK